jgi:hypothetical protein
MSYRWVVVAVAVLMVGVGVTLVVRSDGGGGGSSAPTGAPRRRGCGPVVHEPLDPRSGLHVLPGAPAPAYATNPPTSGPHEPGPQRQGVLTTPLSAPAQVGALEAGQVLAQFRGLSDADRARLNGVAGTVVVVVPNPTLPNPVVLTAWQTKQRCATVDLVVIRAFALRYGGHPLP